MLPALITVGLDHKDRGLFKAFEQRLLNMRGIRIHRDRDARKVWLCQYSYSDKIVAIFNLQKATRPPHTPLPIGALTPHEGEASPQEIYAYQQRVGSITARPDISRPCSRLAEFMKNPSPAHAAAADRVILYLAGTRHLAIEYSGCDVNLQDQHICIASSDAAYADDPDARRSSVIALSTTQAPTPPRA